MKNKKKLNNKGFSLVELIIVVAIMAVLVGVLAPQYMRYVDRSRAGVDEQYADNIRQAMTTCLLDPAITDDRPANGSTGTITTQTGTDTADYWYSVFMTLGLSSTGNAKDELKLDTSTDVDINYSIDSIGNVTITIEDGKYDTYPVSVG